MNFRPTAFKLHTVHICLYQPDTVSRFARRADLTPLSSTFLKSNPYLDLPPRLIFPCRAPATTDVRFYFSFFLVSVHDSVCWSFAEC
jgi:hypothetical protein